MYSRSSADECLCVLPLKSMVEPEVQLLKQGTQCTVKWSSKKLFAATVIDIGMLLNCMCVRPCR